jgi:hypothetical protein
MYDFMKEYEYDSLSFKNRYLIIKLEKCVRDNCKKVPAGIGLNLVEIIKKHLGE